MSRFLVDVMLAVDADDVSPERISEVVEASLRQQAIQPPATVNIRLTTDAELADLNAAYRQIENPTDVLSFADGEAPFPNEPIHLGDIAISVPYAQRQAVKMGHSLSAEIDLLTVHGVLHLLGYDHATEDERAAMWHEQAEILEMVSAEITSPPLALFSTQPPKPDH